MSVAWSDETKVRVIQFGWEKTAWTADLIERLRTLWATGMSATAIGTEMHLSKNSVIGAAHRYGLPPRSSPIRNPTHVWQPEEAERAVTLAKRGHSAPAIAHALGRTVFTVRKRLRAARAKRQVVPLPIMSLDEHVQAPAARAPVLRPILHSTAASCMWPIGDPRDRGNFRFCGCSSVVSYTAYCKPHFEAAYTRMGASGVRAARDPASAGYSGPGGNRDDWHGDLPPIIRAGRQLDAAVPREPAASLLVESAE